MTLSLLISDAFAQTATTAAAVAATPAAPTIQSTLMQFLPLFLIFGVFYLFLIRPQQKRFEEHKKLVEGLRRGDKVVTGGGILGTIVKVEEGDEVTVEIAENVKIRVLKNTIQNVNAKTEPKESTTDVGKNGK
jgi:preprotein translocase subunit YajC